MLITMKVIIFFCFVCLPVGSRTLGTGFARHGPRPAQEAPWLWPGAFPSDNPSGNVIDDPGEFRQNGNIALPGWPQSEENVITLPTDQWSSNRRPTAESPNEWRPNESDKVTTDSDSGATTPTTFHMPPRGCNCPSTPQYNPVCGSDGNTYKNAGLLKCFRRCGINVTQRRMGSC